MQTRPHMPPHGEKTRVTNVLCPPHTEKKGNRLFLRSLRKELIPSPTRRICPAPNIAKTLAPPPHRQLAPTARLPCYCNFEHHEYVIATSLSKLLHQIDWSSWNTMNTYIATNKKEQQLQHWDEKVHTPWHILLQQQQKNNWNIMLKQLKHHEYIIETTLNNCYNNI